mmetsp:Transcript_19342/g.48324  ORF Transcript_19342/g.48324 Transcript_19342/m.48324 type:complete len:99 (+) Transcript_19342:79-375(+)
MSAMSPNYDAYEQEQGATKKMKLKGDKNPRDRKAQIPGRFKVFVRNDVANNEAFKKKYGDPATWNTKIEEVYKLQAAEDDRAGSEDYDDDPGPVLELA